MPLFVKKSIKYDLQQIFGISKFNIKWTSLALYLELYILREFRLK